MANYRAQARQFARQYGLNPGVFVRQIQQESSFRPNAISPAGARGIAQFMPGTAAGLGINPDNPTQALKGAAKLMAGYVHKYGSYRDALIAYNAGPGAIGRPLPAETQHYIATILGGSNPSTGGAQAGTQGTPGVRTTTSTTSLAPGIDQQRRAALAQFVLAGPKADPLALAQNYAKLGQETQTTTKVTTTPGTPGTAASKGTPAGKGGVAKFGGKPVAGWIEPILAYARAHGWQGSVTSGYRSFADQQRIYNSGVRPAARPGTSNHEFTAYPGGAVDVSNAAQLAQILARSPYAGKLQWAGSKDPVHFSHPHNGSY